MPRVVPVMRRLPVSRGMVPRVMVVSVPVVIVMTARGRVRSDAAVVEVQGVRLADAVSRLRLLHGWDAARAAAGTAAPRVPRATLRRSRATNLLAHALVKADRITERFGPAT